MSFAVLRNRCSGWWMPGMAVVLTLALGSCTLKFPEEWLEGECGDGYVGVDEQCDDGDNNSGDGCSATCLEEDGFDCVDVPSVCTTTCGDGVTAGVEQCDDGNTTPGDGCDESCNTEIQGCGDGEVVSGDGEECDDGGQAAFDGCDDQCLVEAGWDCNGSPSVCTEICGDGLVVGDETVLGGCDDGNSTDGDGCDFQCQVEDGYICVNEPSQCQTGCDDGTIAGIEQCDDGNSDSGDGCDASCQLEDGWDCSGEPTVCAETCGDGTVVGVEAQAGGCDDGNSTVGDGCAADCTEEAGWTCTGEPSSCITTCGDGVVAGTEVCDDGDALDCAGGSCRGDCSADETGCGDGFLCGAEAAVGGCDDGNNDNGDGCGVSCIEETGWDCIGEPSVCTLSCTVPQALLLQAGCTGGDKCTINSGNIECGPTGATPAYQNCVQDSECEAGTWCVLLPGDVIPTCTPFCETSADCPGIGSCALTYNPGSWSVDLCESEDACNPTLVNPPTCSAGEACYLLAVGTWCEPAGSVPIGGDCSASNFSCVPSASCIFTGTEDLCFEICSFPGGPCDTAGTTCTFLGDPDWGICDIP